MGNKGKLGKRKLFGKNIEREKGSQHKRELVYTREKKMVEK